LRSLVSLAAANQLLPELANGSVFDLLAASPEGRRILEQFDQLVDRYGYLSEVGTDIAVPTWKTPTGAELFCSTRYGSGSKETERH